MTETIDAPPTLSSPHSTGTIRAALALLPGLRRGDHAGRHRDSARAEQRLSLPEVVAEGILARMPGALF
jgi:hypothetical protein